jgi:hypothetical protein
MDPTTGQMSTSGADLGRITLCEESEGWVRFKNTDCVATDVIALKLGGNQEFTILEAPAVPLTLGPGQEDSVRVHFKPSNIGARGDVLQLKTKRGITIRDYALPVVAAASNSLATTASQQHLDLGVISLCDSTAGMFYLINRGCDSLQIAEINITGSTAFTFDSEIKAKWIKRGDSILVGITAIPLSTGFHTATGELRVRSARGATTAAYVTMSVVFEGNRDPWTLAPATLGVSIPPCETRDTVITMYNPRTCDTLTIAAITVGDDQHIQLSHDVLPRRLLPGDTMRIRVHMDPGVESQINDRLRITGSIDTTIPISIQMRGVVRGSAELLAATTEYRAPLCKTARGEVRLVAHGCRGLNIGGIGIDNSSRFRITSTHSLPLHLRDGESLLIDIEYDADLIGADVSELLISSPDTVLRVPLRGTITTTREIFGLGLLGDPTYELEPGEEITMYLVTLTALSDQWALRQLETGLTFDPRVLTLVDARGAIGWNVTSTPGDNGADLLLTHPATPLIPAGTALATLRLRARFSSTKETDIRLMPLQLNGGDVEYTRCIVSTMSGSASAHVFIPKNCGERLLDSIRKKFYREIQIVRVETPSPSVLRVELEAGLACELEISLHDLLGREFVLKQHHAEVGRSSCTLDGLSLPSGSYFLRVRSARSVATVPLQIR